MAKSPKTHYVPVPAYMLANMTWTRLRELVDDDLSHRDRIPEEAVAEAEILLQIKRAIAAKANFILLQLEYEETGENQS